MEVEEAYRETGGAEEKISRGDTLGAGPWVDYSDHVWNEIMGMNSVSSFHDWGCHWRKWMLLVLTVEAGVGVVDSRVRAPRHSLNSGSPCTVLLATPQLTLPGMNSKTEMPY